MFNLNAIVICTAIALGAIGVDAFVGNGTAIEFHPSSGPEACGFVIEPDAIAILLSPQMFDASLCQEVSAVAFGNVVQTMPISGICFACEGTEVAISTEGYIALGAPEETTIPIFYDF